MLALEIGVGVWIGFVFSAASVWAFVTVAEQIKLAHRYGRPWWKWYAGSWRRT